MRKRLSQADRRRRTVTKKAHSERKTRASIRTNPVLSKGHPQDVAHPATAKQAESDSETELYSVAYLSETAHSQLLLTESVTQGREQTGSGKDRDPDGSRRREGLEPTPTREQAGLGRRTPQLHAVHTSLGKLSMWEHAYPLVSACRPTRILADLTTSQEDQGWLFYTT